MIYKLADSLGSKLKESVSVLWLCNGTSSALLLVPCVDVAMVLQTC